MVNLLLCENCLNLSLNKLMSDDFLILEYLENQGAYLPQCSISRENIKKELNLTSYKCFSALSRLECLEMIDKQNGTKANKHYITSSGKKILKILENKLNEVN